MADIEWYLESVAIKDLIEHPRNPRQLSKHDAKHLGESLDKFGLIDKPIVNTDGLIIGGHQRLRLLKKRKIKHVEVWKPSRELTDREVDELNIRANKATGDWDWDALANEWNMEDLLDWGFEESELIGPECDEEGQLPDLKGEPELTQITFTLSHEQKEEVQNALAEAKKIGPFIDTGNENSNGNALARVCGLWLRPGNL